MPPRVKPDQLVKTDPPTTATIMKNLIGATDVEGKQGIDINTSPSAEESKAGNGLASDNNETFNTANVEQMPEFPGGMGAWSKYLSKNLRYPTMAQENNVTGRVIVSFVVEKNGEISNLKILRGIGAGCDEEALRVIKKSPFWKPGIQNGKAVRVSYVMPIVFQLAD